MISLVLQRETGSIADNMPFYIRKQDTLLRICIMNHNSRDGEGYGGKPQSKFT